MISVHFRQVTTCLSRTRKSTLASIKQVSHCFRNAIDRRSAMRVIAVRCCAASHSDTPAGGVAVKNRHFKFVGLLSLIAYVTLVAMGQALHSIPGCECDCIRNHSHTAISPNACGSPSQCESSSKTAPDEKQSRWGSANDCLLCEWFVMAQQSILNATPSSEAMANSLTAKPTYCRRLVLSVEVLPRGPPLRFVSRFRA